MEVAEFTKAVKLSQYEEVLSCRSELFATALDDLHEAIWDKDLPEDFDWMADRVYGMIYKGQKMDASMFPGRAFPSSLRCIGFAASAVAGAE